MKNLTFLAVMLCSLLSFPAFSQNNFMDFDGANDEVVIPNAPEFNFPGGEFTYEAWGKSSTVGTWDAQSALVSHRTGGGDVRGLLPSGSSNTVGFWLTNIPIFTPAIPDIDSWHHYAGTFDGTTMKLYLDGVMVASATPPGVSITTSAESVFIGRDNCCTPPRFFNGQIDEVRIWNVARTDAEILASYNSELTGGEAGLLAYYNFNEGDCGNANTTVMDQTTAGTHTGTMVGFAGNGCSSNIVCTEDCPSFAAPPISGSGGGGTTVPTMGQWGLIILTLLLLSFATIAIRRRQLVMTGAVDDSSVSFRALPFDKGLFLKILSPVSILVLVIFTLAIALFGYELTKADIPGSIIAVPLLAYLLHLLGNNDQK